MTEAEAQKVISMLAAYFPGRLPEETQVAWSLEIEECKFADGVAGARALGRTAQHPQLRELLECIAAAKKERLRREAQDLSHPALAARATPDDEQQLRTRVAAKVARMMVERRIAEHEFPTACDEMMRAARKDDALRAELEGEHAAALSEAKPDKPRRRSSPEMSVASVAQRQAELRAQSERLEREAMADAFTGK